MKLLLNVKVQLIGVLPAPCELPLVAAGSVDCWMTAPELLVRVPVKAPKETGTSTEVLAMSCAGLNVCVLLLPLLVTALYVLPLSQTSEIGPAFFACVGSAPDNGFDALPAEFVAVTVKL